MSQQAVQTMVKTFMSNDVDEARKYIEAGLPLDKAMLNEPSLIHMVVRRCNLDMLKMVLECGGDPNFYSKRFASTPLHAAIATHRWPTVDFLLAAGADISFVPADPHPNHHTPFQLLVSGRLTEKVREYALRCNVDMGQRTVSGKTLIQIAGNNPEMKELIRSLKTELDVRRAVPSSDDGKRQAARSPAL